MWSSLSDDGVYKTRIKTFKSKQASSNHSTLKEGKIVDVWDEFNFTTRVHKKQLVKSQSQPFRIRNKHCFTIIVELNLTCIDDFLLENRTRRRATILNFPVTTNCVTAMAHTHIFTTNCVTVMTHTVTHTPLTTCSVTVSLHTSTVHPHTLLNHNLCDSVMAHTATHTPFLTTSFVTLSWYTQRHKHPLNHKLRDTVMAQTATQLCRQVHVLPTPCPPPPPNVTKASVFLIKLHLNVIDIMVPDKIK